jgi:hypothetical protein
MLLIKYYSGDQSTGNETDAPVVLTVEKKNAYRVWLGLATGRSSNVALSLPPQRIMRSTKLVNTHTTKVQLDVK